MAAKRSSFWFGYLEAGEKGSPVVRDDSMDMGTPSTVYLFNRKKGRILEYRRAICEPKLRELRDDEIEMVASIQKAFEKARDGFTPRATRRPASPPRKSKPQPEPDLPDFDDDVPLLGEDIEIPIAEDDAI